MSELTPGQPPERVTLKGQYCQLEPISPSHAPALFAAVSGEGAKERYRYVFSYPSENVVDQITWATTEAAAKDHICFAVIDQVSGDCGGYQSLMRIRPEHCSVEIGGVMWGRGIARTRIATEAVYLFAAYAFEQLQYRRFEWKCNNLNEPSKRAAIRFGFSYEGVFRNDMIIKSQSRDTAWYSILDSEWSQLKRVYENWLAPENFDAAGNAKTALATKRS